MPFLFYCIYLFIYIVVQVQLSPFSCNHFSLPHPPPFSTLNPPFGFVHGYFIHVPWWPFPFFLLLNNIPLYVNSTLSLSVHPLMGIFVTSMSWLLWIIWKCRHLFEILISISLCIYPEMGLLDQVVLLFLIFWKHFILFSIVTSPIYTHQ